MCYDFTGDQSHSGGFPQSTGPVAGEVSEALVYKRLVWKVLIHFIKRHHWSRGGGRILQAVAKGSRYLTLYISPASVILVNTIPVISSYLGKLKSFRSASFWCICGNRATGFCHWELNRHHSCLCSEDRKNQQGWKNVQLRSEKAWAFTWAGKGGKVVPRGVFLNEVQLKSGDEDL